MIVHTSRYSRPTTSGGAQKKMIVHTSRYSRPTTSGGGPPGARQAQPPALALECSNTILSHALYHVNNDNHHHIKIYIVFLFKMVTLVGLGCPMQHYTAVPSFDTSDFMYYFVFQSPHLTSFVMPLSKKVLQKFYCTKANRPMLRLCTLIGPRPQGQKIKENLRKRGVGWAG